MFDMKKNNSQLSMNSCPLYPAVLQKAIVLAGLTWGVPPAQYYAMQTWAFHSMSTLTTELKDGTTRIKMEKYPETTLLGLPIELDDSLPVGLIQLRWQGSVIFEIQNIAVPNDF